MPAVILVAIAAVLSLPRLGSRQPWLDEVYTVGATNQLFDTWRNTAGTQALYYLLVWPISQVSTQLAWLRFPSALFGMAAVVVVFRLGRRIGGQRVAVLAAGGLALSWGLARYSIEARSYALALLLVSLSWFAAVAVVQADSEKETRRMWRLFYVVTVLVPLTHGLATLNYVAQLGALAVAPDDDRQMLRRAVKVAPVVGLELGALFLLGAGEVGNWVEPLNYGQLRVMKQLFLGFDVTGLVLTALTAWAVFRVVRGFLRERTQRTWLRMLLVFWAFGPPIMVVLLSLVRPYAAARYVFPSLPAFFLLLAGLVVQLGSTRRVALISAGLAGLLLLDHPKVTTNGIEDWSGVTACIAANSTAGDRVATAAAHRPALDYHWSEHPELTEVVALAPPEEFGAVRRLYESLTDSREELRDVLLQDTDQSIWYIERGGNGRLSIVGLAFDRQIANHYTLTRPWFFEGQLSLVRLDPVGMERPRGNGSCDTVETPEDMKPNRRDD